MTIRVKAIRRAVTRRAASMPNATFGVIGSGQANAHRKSPSTTAARQMKPRANGDVRCPDLISPGEAPLSTPILRMGAGFEEIRLRKGVLMPVR